MNYYYSSGCASANTWYTFKNAPVIKDSSTSHRQLLCQMTSQSSCTRSFTQFDTFWLQRVWACNDDYNNHKPTVHSSSVSTPGVAANSGSPVSVTFTHKFTSIVSSSDTCKASKVVHKHRLGSGSWSNTDINNLPSHKAGVSVSVSTTKSLSPNTASQTTYSYQAQIYVSLYQQHTITSRIQTTSYSFNS